MDRSGDVLLSVGEIDVPVFLRSTAKPFIAAAIVREGVGQRFGIDGNEIAVMAGSHNGEPFHIEAVRSILRKIGLDETALQCGPHAPYDGASARALERSGIPFGPIYNNCSGKHAGILALCLAIGADTATYLNPQNPAEQRILALCARLSGAGVQDLPIAVDGCGIPVYATSLRNAARSFARFASLEGVEELDAAALATVREAMIKFPQYVGGTGEFDTVLMQSAAGAIAVKSGAEGVNGTAMLRDGTGMVLKVTDGGSRAVAPAAVHLLRRLNYLDAPVLDAMEPFEKPVIRNRAGRVVGRIVPRIAELPTRHVGR